MAWVAKIENVEKKIQRAIVPQEGAVTPVVTEVLRYEFTVRFYDKDNPANSMSGKTRGHGGDERKCSTR
jgi:hypothetical protein